MLTFWKKNGVRWNFLLCTYLQHLETDRADTNWFVYSKFYNWNFIRGAFATEDSTTMAAEKFLAQVKGSESLF